MKAIVFLIFFFCLALFAGFVWMIGLGILSHVFHSKNLSIGFWPSVLVAAVVNILLGGYRGNKN